MSPDKQRIAIAEACGHLNPRQTETGSFVASSLVTPCGQYVGTHGLPDYINDLNAMREAEGILDDAQQERYVRLLLGSDDLFPKIKRWIEEDTADEYWQRHGSSIGWDEAYCFCVAADASEKAECLLKAIGKWEDEK